MHTYSVFYEVGNIAIKCAGTVAYTVGVKVKQSRYKPGVTQSVPGS